MKSGDNKMSDFEKNYLRAGAVRLVNVVISYRFEHLFFQTYFMQGELVENEEAMKFCNINFHIL